MSTLPGAVRIVEVGPRDGLQNEKAVVPVDTRIAFIDRLSEAGLPVIEAGAFVSPRWVPQMASSEEVFAGITRRPGTRYTALVPNETGLDRALAAGANEVAVFTAASEAFAQKNINMTIDGSLTRFEAVVRRANDAGLRVRGYISTVWVCPYAGEVAPQAAFDVASRLFDMGCYEVSLGDTVGFATPGDVQRVLELMLKRFEPGALAVHFHDTRGTALANVFASLQMGISVVDSSAGGLGGCPYAPGASGNLATEDLVYMLERMGIATGIDLLKLTEASIGLARVLGRLPFSHYVQSRWKELAGFVPQRPVTQV